MRNRRTHRPRDLRLTDGSKGEGLPFILHVLQSLHLFLEHSFNSKIFFNRQTISCPSGRNNSLESSSGWRHVSFVCSGIPISIAGNRKADCNTLNPSQQGKGREGEA